MFIEQGVMSEKNILYVGVLTTIETGSQLNLNVFK